MGGKKWNLMSQLPALAVYTCKTTLFGMKLNWILHFSCITFVVRKTEKMPGWILQMYDQFEPFLKYTGKRRLGAHLQ